MGQKLETEYLEKIGLVREEIDAVDSQLIPLLIARMKCSQKVAEIKRTAGKPVYDPVREQEILDSIRSRGGDYGDSLSAIYENIMSVSRAKQHAMLERDCEIRELVKTARRQVPAGTGRVICQGVEGAYSHEAAMRLMENHGEIVFTPSFADVFTAVENKTADFGVLPVENSAAGSVSEVYNLLLKYRFFIVGACTLRVRHCIVKAKGTGPIKEVISHPQALRQCSEFLTKNGIMATEYSNTAAAAKHVMEAKREGLGAICSVEAAETYGLEIVGTNIQNEKQNATRFVMISRELILPEHAAKISLCFSLPHQVGSLFHVLENFSANGLNLTKIESGPIPNTQFEYDFYLDFTGNILQAQTLNLICALHEELPRFSLLGNYLELEGVEQ